MSSFSAIDYESLMHWSAELSRTPEVYIWAMDQVSNGSSKRWIKWASEQVSEIAIHSDKPFIMQIGNWHIA